MLAGMAKTMELLVVLIPSPVQLPPEYGIFVGYLQVNQHIGVGQPFPHIRNIRVLLGDMPYVKSIRFQPCNQGGFTRPTWAYHSDDQYPPGFSLIYDCLLQETGSQLDRPILQGHPGIGGGNRHVGGNLTTHLGG